MLPIYEFIGGYDRLMDSKGLVNFPYQFSRKIQLRRTLPHDFHLFLVEDSDDIFMCLVPYGVSGTITEKVKKIQERHGEPLSRKPTKLTLKANGTIRFPKNQRNRAELSDSVLFLGTDSDYIEVWNKELFWDKYK